MKKELQRLLNSSSATLQINQYFKLKRFTEDILSNDIDVLQLESNLLSSCSNITEIKSRDFEGIIQEIKQAMQNDFDNARDKLLSDFENGYFRR